MKLKPLHDRLLVKRLNEEERTKGGIIIPDTAKEKPLQGKVEAAGPGRHNDRGELVPMDIKAGDRILFGKYTGNEIKLDGEEYIIMRQEDVLAVIEQPKK